MNSHLDFVSQEGFPLSGKPSLRLILTLFSSRRLTKAEERYLIHPLLEFRKMNYLLLIMEIVAFSARWVGSIC